MHVETHTHNADMRICFNTNLPMYIHAQMHVAPWSWPRFFPHDYQTPCNIHSYRYAACISHTQRNYIHTAIVVAPCLSLVALLIGEGSSFTSTTFLSEVISSRWSASPCHPCIHTYTYTYSGQRFNPHVHVSVLFTSCANLFIQVVVYAFPFKNFCAFFLAL
jgi:hypothetical protein